MKEFIENIQNEIADIKEILATKEKRLLKLSNELYEVESKLYPLINFIGQAYIFDKPYKWSSPRTEKFTEQELNDFNYLIFNGIYSGKELNSIYEHNYHQPEIKFEEDCRYVTFSIPDEYFKKDLISKIIPLGYIHELLSFKLTE